MNDAVAVAERARNSLLLQVHHLHQVRQFARGVCRNVQI